MAAVEKIPPLPNTCRFCGQGRAPEAEFCTDRTCQEQRAKKSVGWVAQQNGRQQNFRTRGHRRRR
jgi:hypothetical protein